MRAHPVPRFTWRRKESILDLPESTRDLGNGVYESSLTIRRVSDRDYGAYSCEAQNEAGRSKQELLFLEAPGRPGKPLGLRLRGITPTSVGVEWARGFDGGFDALSHNITAVPLDSAAQAEALTQPCDDEVCVAIGLKPATR